MNVHPTSSIPEDILALFHEAAQTVHAFRDLEACVPLFPSAKAGEYLLEGIRFFSDRKIKQTDGTRDGRWIYRARALQHGQRVTDNPGLKMQYVEGLPRGILWSLILWARPSSKPATAMTAKERMYHKKLYGTENPMDLVFAFLKIVRKRLDDMSWPDFKAAMET